MHFGIFRNKLFRIFRMVILIHFGFLLTGLKKKSTSLQEVYLVFLRSLGILEVILDYGANIRR